MEFYSLESIIKVEPEEFQRSVNYDHLRLRANIFSDPIVVLERLDFNKKSSLDYILRSKANITSDPIVLLKRVKIEKFTSATRSIVGKGRERIVSSDNYALLIKGNEGVSYKNPHTCCFCRKILRNRGSLSDHIERHHCKSKKMFCDLCPKTFFCKRSVSSHIRSVHERKRFFCNICDFKTSMLTDFKFHKTTHEERTECEICKKLIASSKKGIDLHMATHKPKKECAICKKMVAVRFMRGHLKIHATKPHKCKKCKEAFPFKVDLRRHNLRNHYEGTLFECHCGSVYSSKLTLKKHQRIHDENSKKACRVCQKQFFLPDLRQHWNKMHLKRYGPYMSRLMKVINKKGPFICDKCGAKCSSRPTFTAHSDKYHRGVQVFCDLCPQSFRQKWLVERHIKQHHLKPLECKVCGFRCGVKSAFKKHMIRHASKTKCKVCHKLVTNLRNHMRVHDQIQKKCRICGNSYCLKYLPKHITLMHAKCY